MLSSRNVWLKNLDIFWDSLEINLLSLLGIDWVTLFDGVVFIFAINGATAIVSWFIVHKP